AHLPVAQTALPVAKDFFNPTAHRTEQSVDSLHHRRQGPAAFAPGHDAIANPACFEPATARGAGVGFVGDHDFFLAADHRFEALTVMHAGGTQVGPADQGAVSVSGHVGFVTVMGLPAFDG